MWHGLCDSLSNNTRCIRRVIREFRPRAQGLQLCCVWCLSWPGAYTNLVKLQMQQQEHDETTQAEVEEVLEAGGKPVTRHSLDRVLQR